MVGDRSRITVTVSVPVAGFTVAVPVTGQVLRFVRNFTEIVPVTVSVTVTVSVPVTVQVFRLVCDFTEVVIVIIVTHTVSVHVIHVQVVWVIIVIVYRNFTSRSLCGKVQTNLFPNIFRFEY